MRKMILLLISLGLTFVCTLTVAQNKRSNRVKTLTLKDAILLAVRCNPEVRSEELQRISDKYSLEVARNEFLPQYVFNAQGEIIEGRDPLGNVNPHIRLKTIMGTELEIGGRLSRHDGTDTSDVTLGVRQPLLRGFGSDVTLSSWRNALDSEQISKLTLKDQVQSTITKVISGYYKLVEDYNKLDVDKLALNDSLSTLHDTKLRIKTGKLAPLEVTQQQAQVEDLHFAISQDNNAIDRDYQDLLILLGVSPTAKFNIVRTIPTKDIALPSLKKSINIALYKNIGYVKQLIGLRSQERSLMLAKNDQWWRLDLVGSMNRDITGHLHLHNLDDKVVYNEKRVGLELEIPIDDKPRKQKLLNANINLKKYHIALDNACKQLRAQVVKIVRDLQAQKHQINVARRSVTLSEQSLRIAQRKFDFGRTTMFELTSLRKALTMRKNELISQRIAYLNSLAQYQQTLGVTLDRWRLKLASFD